LKGTSEARGRRTRHPDATQKATMENPREKSRGEKVTGSVGGKKGEIDL